MMLRIDSGQREVVVGEGPDARRLPMASREAFDLVSEAWMQCGWDAKYVYGFSWFGRPVIQHPEDIVRVQEVLYRLKPDVLIETGVAHGGSLTFYASLFEAMGRGRAIGVDIEIRPHNRAALESHELRHRIELIEGSSVAPDVVARVRRAVAPGESVFVMLDSNHSYEHVLAELEAYAPLVTGGSYIVAADGIMQDVVGAPRSGPDWATNNPVRAVMEFVAAHPEFRLEQPAWPFNETNGLGANLTYFRSGWLRRV